MHFVTQCIGFRHTVLTINPFPNHMVFIQGDSGGHVNDSIGHGEKQKSYEHVPNNERLSRQELLESRNTKALLMIIT